MKVTIAAIHGRDRENAFQALADLYIERLAQYIPVESRTYRTESAFSESIAKLHTRTAPIVVLLDGRGKSFSSEDLARWIGRRRDEGAQNLIFAVGPANGWSEAIRSVVATQPGGLMLSLSAMTLPHELARVVLAEQVYRASTILANHPYHKEH